MTTSAKWFAGVALAIVVAGCGGATAPVAHRWISGPVADVDLPTAIAELEFAIASNPADLAAHRGLAHLLQRVGRPGAALAQFEIVRRNQGLTRPDRVALASLLVDRASARLALGQGDAIADLELAHAVDRDSDIPAQLQVEAYFQAARAAFAGGRRDRGAEMLQRAVAAGATATQQARLAALDPEGAEVGRLGVAAVWLWDGGARRIARDLLDRYFERGGRDPEVLRRLLLARRWWGGAGARPGLLELDQVAAAGVDLCPVAATLDELGCGRSVVTMKPAAAAALRRRAASRYWRTANPEQAAAWVGIALSAWTAGEVESWFAELSRRVDVDQVVTQVPADRLAGFASATLLRAAGSPLAARAALARAIDGAAELSAEQRAVVVAEAAIQDLPTERVDAVLASGPVAASGWEVVLRDARRRDDATREAALLSRAPRELAGRYLSRAHDLELVVADYPSADPLSRARDRHELARWQRATSDFHLETGRDAVVARWRSLGDSELAPTDYLALPLGAIEPLAIAHQLGLATDVAPGELIDLVWAYLREPATADRLAQELVDGAVAIGERGPLVAALFGALGDPARALAWWDQVLASSPRHPPYLLATAAAAVAAGDFSRADVHVLAGAAASGDGGAVNAAAARIYLDAGAAVPALEAGRRALQLCAPGEELRVLDTIAAAEQLLGRSPDAAATRAARIARIAPDYRDAATASWRGRRDRLIASQGRTGSLNPGADGKVEALALYPADGGLAIIAATRLSASGRTDQAIAVLTTAARWNPSDVATRVALLGYLDPGSVAAQRLVAELLLIALGNDSQAEMALTALQQIFTSRGDQSAAGAVAQELRGRQQGAHLRQLGAYRERGCW